MTIIAKAVLLDVQGLFGGQNLFLNRAGLAFVEIVRMRLPVPCKRYKFHIPTEKLDELESLLIKNDFYNLKEQPDRYGVPDEAHPTIIITPISGKEKKVWKWANDKHPKFDAIYDWMLTIIKRAESDVEPFFEGKFDYDWKPDSF